VNEQKSVLFCGCANSDIIPVRVKRRVLGTLLANGVHVHPVGDLCGLAARRDPLLRELVATGNMLVAACHPRATHWLFSRAGADMNGARIRVANMRNGDIEDVLRVIFDGNPPEPAAEVDLPAGEDFDGWPPWFPVIDYDRCRNCRQCLDFCLFGVYETDADGRVTVSRPERCKNKCPACARICPEAAIIFPKVSETPINGAVIDDEELTRANIKVNLDKALGDDIYAALAQRKKKRRQLLRREQDAKRASDERRSHTGGR
jgi:NAD-dependent dihydropyrimidine dehydrogenase PreA subunit